METTSTRSVLIVDDEKLFRESLAEGLTAIHQDWRLLAAGNGREALEILEASPVDLVLTDLKMPELDGFDLVARMSSEFPAVPVIVMTAFGSPEISERLGAFGVGQLIEKPVDFETIARRVTETFDGAASGVVRGISLATFLQLLELERKSCRIRVSTDFRTGVLHLLQGAVVDAETGGLQGEAAAREMIGWERVAIELAELGSRPTRRITTPLQELLLEALRLQDERNMNPPPAAGPETISTTAGDEIAPHISDEEAGMSAQDVMKELGSIEGFAGAGVYTPTGESLALVSNGNGFNKEIGIHANNVLLNAQKASLDMGAGRGQMVHVEGEKAHILVRCLNEGTDPLKSEPGKAHIHVVLALANDSAIGFAKMKLGSVAEKVAPHFRL